MASGGGMANRSGEKAWCCTPTRRALLVGPGSAALTSVRPGRRGGGTGGVAAEGFERVAGSAATAPGDAARSEEHTSELQSLMRISYAVFCLKKKKQT